ncbi:unnamed protein product, partial [marine sediment metagenome]
MKDTTRVDELKAELDELKEERAKRKLEKELKM